ncbi:hypothetical protein G7Y89_g11495 [Cudoniella acicularis]|uniref:Zn(2)-C6 fungal-type domain-containing protein n=1 Tax=Cudoniella acicularis TaxID=354080 RepID=A0A8H4RBV4_9HELO|nr:hypothetical protein G7Y89_g11495 [Cudoniella acicularis]
MATSPTYLDATYASPPTISGTEHGERSRSHLSLRRDKPQLSCNLCRKRKVRCDRQNPCATCSRRGLARSCVYSTDAQENILPQSTGTVHERIHQLESLVISLMRQDTTTPACVTTGSISISDPPNGSAQKQITSHTAHPGFGGSGSQSPAATTFSSATRSTSFVSAIDVETNANISSVRLDGGCMKFNNLGTANYVGSSHWAAVLDSIAELKEHFEQEEEIRNMATDFNPSNFVPSSWPQLLYSCQRVTKAEILSSIPPRRAADRLVSRYFTLDIASGVFHSGQFLREYDHFWEDPSAAPIMWVGLLFTIMCLGELHQHSLAPMGNTPLMPTLNPDPPPSVNIFQERIVQDPKHFSEIPAFAGEMRRRVWATIFQIDVGFSVLAGLPRMLKPQQCDTEEPRNLLDSDFDEETLELPQSRPESEVTPVLFLLAKNRIISVGGLISDLAHDMRPYPYTELMRVEKLLQDTRNSLPSSLQWQPLSQSIIQGPQAIMQRVYLDMFFHKMQIILYKKYLSASMTQSQYNHAREVCLDSAMKILEYQHLLDEETQLDGRLSSVRWTYSSILNHNFMLAASVLCFYIKQYDGKDRGVIDQETFQKIRSLLRKSHEIWLRSSTASNEAQKAVQSLSIILGIQHLGEDEVVANHSSDGSEDLFSLFNNPDSWPAYQACSNVPPFRLEATIDEYWAVYLQSGTLDTTAVLDSLSPIHTAL